jgi:CheY-like chemotaxis protein
MKNPKKKTVLFADDDIFLMQSYIDMLESEGYQVITASTGSEAITRVRERQGQFDIVILDIMMRWDKKNQKS